MAVKTPTLSEPDIKAVIQPNTATQSAVPQILATVGDTVLDQNKTKRVAQAKAEFEMQRMAFVNVHEGQPDFELSPESTKIVGGAEKALQRILDIRGTKTVDEYRLHTQAEILLTKLSAQSPGLQDEFLSVAQRLGLRPVGASLREIASKEKDKGQNDTSRLNAIIKQLNDTGYDGVASNVLSVYTIDYAERALRTVLDETTHAASLRRSLTEITNSDALGDKRLEEAAVQSIGQEAAFGQGGILFKQTTQNLEALAAGSPEFKSALDEMRLWKTGQVTTLSTEAIETIGPVYAKVRREIESRYLTGMADLDATTRDRLLHSFNTNMSIMDGMFSGADLQDIVNWQLSTTTSNFTKGIADVAPETVSKILFFSKDLGLGGTFSDGADLNIIARAFEDVTSGRTSSISLEGRKLKDQQGRQRAASEVLASMIKMDIATFNELPAGEKTGKIMTHRQAVISNISTTDSAAALDIELENLATLTRMQIASGSTPTEEIQLETQRSIGVQLLNASRHAYGTARELGVTPQYNKDGTMTLDPTTIPKDTRGGIRSRREHAKRVTKSIATYNNLIRATSKYKNLLGTDLTAQFVLSEAADLEEEARRLDAEAETASTQTGGRNKVNRKAILQTTAQNIRKRVEELKTSVSFVESSEKGASNAE